MPMPTTDDTVAPTIDERVTAMVAQLTTCGEAGASVLRELLDKEIIFGLAADTGQIFQLTQVIAPLLDTGPLLQARLQQIVEIGRNVDALTDPGTIPHVG